MSHRIITLFVNESDLSLIRHIDSATIINNAPGEGFDPEGQVLPFERDEAEGLLDTEGYATAVIEVPLETFIQGVAGTIAGDDIYDVLHEFTFGSLGVTEDSAYEVLGVSGGSSALIIQYTTRLQPHLDADARGAGEGGASA